MLKTAARLKDLERKNDLLVAELADLELKFMGLRRNINRVFSRVSRDFVIHSEKMNPEEEDL